MITPAQSRAARALVGMTQKQLADQCWFGLSKLQEFETGRKVSVEVVETVESVLTAAGVEFIADNGGGAGVRLSKPGRRRGR